MCDDSALPPAVAGALVEALDHLALYDRAREVYRSRLR